MRFKLLIISTSVLCFTHVKAEVTLIESLDFGNVAMVDNDSVQTIAIDRFGNQSVTAGLRFVQFGRPGLIEFTGFAVGSEANVTATIIQPNSSTPVISQENFALTTIDIASTVRIPVSGIAEVPFGGTLSTSGSGSEGFSDTIYTHRVRISIDF